MTAPAREVVVTITGVRAGRRAPAARRDRDLRPPRRRAEDPVEVHPPEEPAMTLTNRRDTHTVGERDRRVVGQRAEVRVVDQGKRQFIARVLTYNTVDDYGTIWRPGCFTDSLAARMPVIAWAHQWAEPIGRYTEVVRDDSTALELLGQLSNFGDVPRARQCYSQMQDGTIDQFSVGFTRQQWMNVDDEQMRAAGACEEMVKALLDEASPVLVGAVPGTSLLAVRSARGKVDLDAVVELARRVKAGDLTVEEADEAVRLMAVDDTPTDTDSTAVVEEEPAADAEALEEAAQEIDALLAEAAATLARSRR
jgi:HK97 family phage prohead protease